MNKINLLEFQNLLRKATLNYSIDNVGITLKDGGFKVAMRGNNAIVILNGPNDVISGISPTDSWDLFFSNPAKNVKSYIDLIIPDDNNEAVIEMMEEKVVVRTEDKRQKTNLFFCSEHSVSKFDREGPKVDGDEVFKFTITQDFVDTFNLIKKVASSFGKMYFVVEEGVVFLEGTDRTNAFANGLKMAIGETEYDKDVVICFDFKNINNIMALLNGDATDFSIRLGYIPQTSGGLASFIKDDNSEKYYLLSIRETA
jgi:hypothetical protein